MSYKKQIFKLNDLKKFLTEENSCVSLMPTVRLLALPPFFLNDMKSGILYLLNNMLKKYDRSLGGIVIGYQNIKVLMDENTGIIPIGTSETEVNISVEFYIFQPRIGSYIEGIVNKKSNNHIGCLVHRYFNATILKPDDIDYEDWICKDFNVDDKIIFKVKDLDFTSLLPYIEGVFDKEIFLNKSKCNVHKNYGTGNLILNDSSKSSQNEISSTKNFLRHKVVLNEESDDDLLESKKVRNKNEEVSTLEDNVNKTLERTDSFTNLRKKKKRKNKDKEEEKLSVLANCNYSEMDKFFNDEEVTSSTIIFNKADESQLFEKKKRKKSTDIGRDAQEGSTTAENAVKVNPNDMDHVILENLVSVEDKKSYDFVKHFKKRKEKKKKNEEEKPQFFNKISQCLSSSKMEDSVLYSTLLNPIQLEKMRISFCSPIPQGTPVERKKGEITSTADLDSAVKVHNQSESDSKEKKKQKKRKREDKESESFPTHKKIKTSHIISFKKEDKEGEMVDDEDNLEVQTDIEQLYNQQLSKVRKTINMSNEDSPKEEKKKKKKFKKRKKEIIQNKELDINKNAEFQINGAGAVEKKTEAQSNKLEELNMEKELKISEKQGFDGNKRTNIRMNNGKEIFKDKVKENSLKVNNISNNQKNCINKQEKKSEVQNIVDELLKQEMIRVKNNLINSDADSVKEEKEIKAVVDKQTMENPTQETMREGSHLSLYEKLLKEAKNAIDLDRDKLANLLPVKELKKTKNKIKNKNIKDSDLSDFSTSSSKKKDLGKKKKHSEVKTEVYHQTPDKYRNGSMYDTSATPEKINPDKSLFLESEQSNRSPVKKVKKADEIETKLGKSLVQNMLDEFCKEERKRLQSESDKEGLINLKKQEKKKSTSEQKSQNSVKEKESLYEKLLKEAKSMIGSKERSPPKKKKKKSETR